MTEPERETLHRGTELAASGARPAQARARRAAGPGLVHSSTSVPPPLELTPELRAQRRLKCLKTSTITAARLLQEQSQAHGGRYRVALLTLTYAHDDAWGRRDITSCIQAMRKYCARRNFPLRYVWVMELTKRGRPHYHMLLWLPRGVTLPKPDRRGWWKLGSTRIEWARNAVGYIAKYASKASTPQAFHFPRSCRIYGAGGLVGSWLREARWWKLPGWAKKHFSPSHDACRVAGGGVSSRVTGEWHPSPFMTIYINGVFIICSKVWFHEWITNSS